MDEVRKNLANCKPSEFMAQCGRVAKSVEKWLEVTDVMNIRRKVPKMMPIPEDATPEKTKEIMDEYKLTLQKAAKDNIGEIINSVMIDHPQETLELLALLCFVEPKNVDDHSISFYLANLAELLNDKDVISFFSSLMRLEQTIS